MAVSTHPQLCTYSHCAFKKQLGAGEIAQWLGAWSAPEDLVPRTHFGQLATPGSSSSKGSDAFF